MIVQYPFTLAEATLSGGAAIVAASAPLPQRITGAIDYEARVMALNPSGYWRLNEASGNFLDRTANAYHFTPNGTPPRSQTGHGRGGDTGVGAKNGSNHVAVMGAGYAAHRLVAGTPFTALLAVRYAAPTANPPPPLVTFIGCAGSPVYSPGFDFQYSLGSFALRVGSGGAGNIIYHSDLSATASLGDCRPHIIGVRYSGGALNAAGSFDFVLDDKVLTDTWVWGGAAATCGAPSNLYLAIPQGGGAWVVQDAAIWTGTRLSNSQIAALASATPCGTARWELPVAAYDRILKGVQIPGCLARSISASESRLGVRAYYQIGAGARTEFDPGDDPSIPIPAGSAAYIDADLVHHHADDLPWIADAGGNGLIALVEEPDSTLPVAVIGITSLDGDISIELANPISTVAAPFSYPPPSIEISGASKVGSTLNLAVIPPSTGIGLVSATPAIRQLRLLFSAPLLSSVNLLDRNNWSITTTDPAAVPVSIVSVTLTSGTITLITSEATSGKTYTVGIPSVHIFGDGTGAPYAGPATQDFVALGDAPYVVSALVLGGNSIDLIFNEEVEQSSASTPGNYTIAPGLLVTGSVKLSPTKYRLTTVNQTPGQHYALTISGVRDLANNTI